MNGIVLALAMISAPAGQYIPLVETHAARSGLEPALVMAVIRVESNFRARAVSPAGARGLMQLMPSTARSLGVADPFDPGENIRGGTDYLAMMLERFGSLPLALAAYNAGPEAVERYGGIPPYRETRAYVARVLSIYGSGDGWGDGRGAGADESSSSPSVSAGIPPIRQSEVEAARRLHEYTSRAIAALASRDYSSF